MGTRSIDMKPAVLFFSAQLINLMIALHQVDILHADFKPDNIMLTEIDTFNTILDANGNIQGIRLICTPWACRCMLSCLAITPRLIQSQLKKVASRSTSPFRDTLTNQLGRNCTTISSITMVLAMEWKSC